jgi:hypothetical protein
MYLHVRLPGRKSAPAAIRNYFRLKITRRQA